MKLVLLASGFSLLLVASVHAESRYVAETAAGARFEGKELHDWHDAKAQPRLDNRKLFDEPLRWVMDAAIPPAEPLDASVELFGGDCLPGRVLGASEGSESIGERYAPHVIVEPSIAVDSAEGAATGTFRVAARWLKRIVWQRRGDSRYRPGTVFFRDGRQVEFRSVRWNPESVRLLVENEPRDVPFGQIAELHLPKQDPWDAWLDQLSAICPEGAGRVVQIETADGLRVTASTERMRAATQGGGERQHWRHVIQPAWCDEPLWVRFKTIRVWRTFAPHEVPLTALDPNRTVYRAALGGGWWPQTDRNVQGGPLQSAGLLQGWGIGVQAYSEIEYPLSKLARSFRTRWGLDHAAADGGCVRATAMLGAPGTPPILDTGVVIGTAEPKDSGALPLNIPDNAPRRLVLTVDPVLTNRPAGADPLEIRDVFDWHQPFLELDPEGLKVELQRRGAKSVPAWNDWTLVTADKAPAVLRTGWDVFESKSDRFGTLIAPRGRVITLSRKWALSSTARWLMVRINRPDQKKPPCTVQVRVEGQALAEFEAPVRTAALDPDPVLVPIPEFAGKTVTVEVSQTASEAEAWADWRSVSAVAEPPMLHRIFEDESAFVQNLPEGRAIVRLDREDKHTGAASLQITPGEKGALRLPELTAKIREVPRMGEYRFLRFAWKKPGKGTIRLHVANDGQWGPEDALETAACLRYSAGPSAGLKTIPLDGNAPQQWVVVVRDLFADFGSFPLTGLKLESQGEGAAAFDGIYLARRQEDLARVDAKLPDPFTALAPEVQKNLVFEIHDPAELSRSLLAVAPAFSTATIGPEGLWLLKSYRDRPRVLRTAPPAADKPFVFRSPLLVPPGKPLQLRLSVSYHDDRPWKLGVFANGQPLHEGEISKATAPAGWLDVNVDLTRFAGENILLEIRQTSPVNAYGYWSRLEVVSP